MASAAAVLALASMVLAGCAQTAVADRPDHSITAKADKSNDPAESLHPGWTAEALQAAVDNCVNQVLALSFADYRRRHSLPPPTEAETASMLTKVAQDNNPMTSAVRSTCNCVTHALAERHDPLYYANHGEKLQSDSAEVLRGGGCPAPQISN
jgi:hypothetical protein